ncbi:hypothetical protein WJX72_005414 [[Myrmecia] bisecta]|uniref:UDP-N-acetylmuramoyl-tripeptide--D-alanyl-D-alanine ligase n=1 Tax=[Myrmecia] bisecta TaxID=41462 RepID=A0AAW1R6T1_9CHLO
MRNGLQLQRPHSWSLDPGGVVFTASDIAEVTGGELIHSAPPGSVTTDTRTLLPGQWFLALQGNNFDGHRFMHEAQARGCAGVIVSAVSLTGQDEAHGIILVDNTLQALQRLAQNVRQRYPGPVVAITGSCGKTTTRTMTGLILSALGPVHQTAGNLNNHVGLPLTLLELPPTAAACVLELGMSARGEIAVLAGICKPTLRVITNVAEVHLAGVGGTLAGVAEAKAELLQTARPSDTLGGEAGLHTHLELRIREAPGAPGTALDVEVPAPGLHLASNAAAAVAVGLALGVPVPGMAASLARYQPTGMRMRVERVGAGITILNDAYNASLMSVQSALQLLREMPAGRRHIVVLGDMKELGPQELVAHVAVMRDCCCQPFDLVALVAAAIAKYHDQKEPQ